MNDLVTLENENWQVGILPTTGASIAFGRVRKGDGWVDTLRPTAEADYGNSSKCSSFIMLPWCNRIGEGKLRFEGREYILRTTLDDVTARHGDVRGRAWNVVSQTSTSIQMTFDSGQHGDVNFPFAFTAEAEYRLEGRDFVWGLALRNEDTQPFPAGFGHHPYFVRPANEPQPEVLIPCDSEFVLVDYLATDAPIPLTPRLDFRQLRALDENEVNDLMSKRQGDAPAQMVWPAHDIALEMYADPIFEHYLLYAPQGQPFFAVEPMTNANDGFNLFERGIAGSGVFVLQPGESARGTVRLAAKQV